MTKTIRTSQPFTLSVLISASVPTVLSIQIADSKRVYADRFYGSVNRPFQGKVWLDFHFPVVPKGFTVKAKSVDKKGKVKVEKTQVKPLVFKTPTVSSQAMDFYAFASEFALSAGQLEQGVYADDNETFVIRYMDEIRDSKGTVLSTYARINRDTGLIEAYRPGFRKMTYTNRVWALLHEYCHYEMSTTDEFACDMYATKLCLDMGHNATECLYSLTKIFEYNGDEVPTLRREQEDRIRVVKQFIETYKKLK